jgi:lysine 2,3-aminomutase
MEGLRGHTSGYSIPTYVVDAPGGGGKIPVQPQYVISQGPGKVVLRNFEGFITTYIEPDNYDPTEITLQPDQPERRLEPGQEGVLGLLEGHRLAIEPEGFEQTHARGGNEHRLRSGSLNSKWQPLGVGAVPAQAELAESNEK